MDKLGNAKELMTTNLVVLSPTDHVFDAMKGLLSKNLTGAPVVNQKNEYLGSFSEKCCMRVLCAMAHRAQESGHFFNAGSTRVNDFMIQNLVTLTPEMDVFEAMGLLLSRKISGAPVVNERMEFLGVFSEKDCMKVLLSSLYDQVPTTNVAAYMNADQNRIISGTTPIFEAADIFSESHYRRLEVIRDGRLVGQICRRDVLKTELELSQKVGYQTDSLLNEITAEEKDAAANPNFGASNKLQGNEDTPYGSGEVGRYMDMQTRTITESTSLLEIASIFLGGIHRRLPVLKEGKIVGQVSRRDVLEACYLSTNASNPPVKEKTILYLSSLVDRQDAPF